MRATHDFYEGAPTIFSGFNIYVASLNLADIFNLILLFISILNVLIVLSFRLYNIFKNKGLNDNTLKEITTMVQNSQKAIEEQISKVKENDRDKIN